MLLSTLREPPRRGSIREFVLTLVVLKKQQIEHARVRVLAQILVDKEAGGKAFEEYMKIAFPWIEKAKSREGEESKKALMKEIAGGPLQVTPMIDPTLSSRKVRRIQRADELTQKEWLPKVSRLMDQMGPRMIPKR